MCEHTVLPLLTLKGIFIIGGRRDHKGTITPAEVAKQFFHQQVAVPVNRGSNRSFIANLYTAGLPDPDLLIRTSGEHRISNFLLWQCAYAELYITPVLWPDFRKKDLLLALTDYRLRERRLGGALPS